MVFRSVLASLFQKPPADSPLDPYEHVLPIHTQPDLVPANGYLTRAIAAGDPDKDPKVRTLLAELDAYLEHATGKTMQEMHTSARELCTMWKTPGQAVAIPHRSFWINMAYLLLHVWLPIRTEMGIPLWPRGFRPPDYNLRVGGAKLSKHIIFAALDIYVNQGDSDLETRTQLAFAGARVYMLSAQKIKMGLKVYGTVRNPSHIHVDAGQWKGRPWIEGAAPAFIKQLQVA